MNLSKDEFQVKDLVIDDEYETINSNATIEDAAKKMKEKGIPDLVILEESSEKVIGVIADFDIVQKVVAEGKNPKTDKVTTAMYVIEPVTLETTVSEAFERMQKLNVNVVPVVDDGKLVGVSSIQDCWSYIPDRVEDDIGLIPVKDVKHAEFCFAAACCLLAFVLGVLLPLAGAYRFFFANHEDVMSLLSMAVVEELRGEIVSFYMFNAGGVNFLAPMLNFFARTGNGIWLVIVIFSFLIVIFGVLGTFSIIYTSYSDKKGVHTGFLVRILIPILLIIIMALQWIFFAIALYPINAPLDGVGLAMSIISMVLFLLAINRDYLFRQKESADMKSDEVTK